MGFGDVAGPDLLPLVAQCARHRALGEVRCGIVYEDLRNYAVA